MPVPPAIRDQFTDWLPPFQEQRDPWLPFAWPVQLGPDGILYAADSARDIEWAAALMQMRVGRIPVAVVNPGDPDNSALDAMARILCWGLNRVVHGVKVDQALAEMGFEVALSQMATLGSLVDLAPTMPDYGQALIALELIYRGIPLADQNQLRQACGEDVLRAAHQLNMACVDPEDPDRTLLQVRRIALKFCGEAAAALEGQVGAMLSDGRRI